MRLLRRNHPGRHEFLLAHLRAGRILDVGNVGGIGGGGPSNSGHVRLRAHLESTSPGSVLVGFDLFAPTDHRERYGDQVRGDLARLPFAEAAFDTVYAGQVLEHVTAPYAALAEIRRVLRPDGRLIFDVPNPYALARMARWLLLREEALGDPTHRLFYTPVIVETMAREAGFEILEIASDDKVSVGKGLRVERLLPARVRRGLGSHLLAACRRPAAGDAAAPASRRAGDA